MYVKKIMKMYYKNVIAILITFMTLSILIGNGTINGYYEGIIIAICINIILATSLNLVTGFLGQLALGHAGFMAVGAYAAALTTLGMDLPDTIQFPISLIVGGVVAGFAGIIIGIPALRLKGDYLGIITLGFGEMIRVFIFNMESITGGARGLKGITYIANFTWVFWVTVLVVSVIYTLTHSRHGRAIISIREDETAAEAMGINIVNFKLMGFTVAAFFAGVGGGVFAHYMTVLDPKTFNFIKSVEILVIVVMGGMGNLTGSIIAAIILTILPEALRDFSEYRMLLYSFLLIVIMIAKTKGLFQMNWEFSLKKILSPLKKKQELVEEVE